MSKTLYEILGARIKTRREELGLRQEDLAASIGLSRTSVTNIERGRQRLFLDQFAEICRVLQITPFEIYPGQVELTSHSVPSQSTIEQPESVRKFLAELPEEVHE